MDIDMDLGMDIDMGIDMDMHNVCICKDYTPKRINDAQFYNRPPSRCMYNDGPATSDWTSILVQPAVDSRIQFKYLNK